MFLKILLNLIITVSHLSGDEHNSCSSSEQNRYIEKNNRWTKFQQTISESMKNFVECKKPACDCYEFVIDRDLESFGDKITKDQITSASLISRVTKYQVINHQLFRSSDCMFQFRCRGIEHFIIQILPFLPDTEFVVNTRDWPQISRYFSSPIPVFSFSKTPEHFDIMYPAWTFWEGGPATSIHPTGLGRWDLHRDSLLKEAKAWPWDAKEDKAFFRGSRTSAERDSLILLSRKRPDVVDAKYTKNQAWKSDKDTLGEQPAEEVTLEEHCRFRYLFNYRGVAASFRLKHLFLCQSLVFHVGSEWEEFFYPLMKPWVHYIPVDKYADQEDLLQLLEFARNNQDSVRRIADRGASFIQDNLTMETVSCYWKMLLLKYTSLLDYSVQKDPELILIKQ